MPRPSPETFSENGARPVQFPGGLPPIDRLGALVSRPPDGYGNTIVGGRPVRRLTRIAGRDVSGADGHTVGKTFCRKELLASPPRVQQRLNRLEKEAGRRLDAIAPGMLRKRHHRKGRGRQASASSRPVSLVPIITGA
jgi:hypothetical protein